MSIYIDGAYSFSLSQNQLLELRLHSGREISEPELADFKRASDFGKLLERTLNFMLIRPRSRRELADYLRRKKAEPQQQTDVTSYLETKGYVSDAAFAKSWVRSRQATRPVSTRRLIMELRQKGVSNDDITAALNENNYDEQHALQQLITKKRRLTRYQDPQKLMHYLLRQGFGYEVIKQATMDEL